MRAWLIGAVVVVTGCATAGEDPYASFGPAAKDGAVADTAAPPAKDSSVTPRDSGSPTEDTSAPVDTATDPDTASTPDTSVPDTFIDPDTGVVDTGTPPVDTGTPPIDTGPTGGMCNWCSTGSCSSLFVDYACLLDCLSAGHADCDYDPTKSMPCTCVD